MPLVWSPDLLLGVQNIDDQHRRIFQILDRLIGAIEAHQGHDEVGAVLASVSMFVAAHFRMEEDLMVQSRFPGLVGHQKSHEAVRLQVEHLVDRYHHEGLDPMDLVRFMEWWLREHVRLHDRPLAEFLTSLDQAAG